MEKRNKMRFFKRFRSLSTYDSSSPGDSERPKIRTSQTLPSTCSLPSTPDIDDNSTTLMATDSSTTKPCSGGYEYEFIEPVPSELICLICNKVLKEAHQVGCCGKLYCLSCLGNIKFENKMFRCPNCSNFAAVNKFFRDVNVISKVNELDIHCPNKDCTWVGHLNTLKDHEQNCPDELVECKNEVTSDIDELGGCGDRDVVHVCGLMLPQSRIQEHMTRQCQWRTSICPHCDVEGVYHYLSGKHLQTCPGIHYDDHEENDKESVNSSTPSANEEIVMSLSPQMLSPQGAMLSSSFQAGGSRLSPQGGGLAPLSPQARGLLSSSPQWGMMSLPRVNNRGMLSPRGSLPSPAIVLPPRGTDHVHPLTPSTTPRVPPRVPRRNKPRDDDSSSSRSSSGYEDLTAGSLGPYVNFTALYFNNILKLLDTSGSGLKVLKSVIETCGVVRVVTEMKHGAESVSSSFYVSKGSFKLLLKLVYLNNSIDEDPTKTSLLASVGLVAGRYDDLIKWPSSGRLKLQLLNQRMDVNHKVCVAEYCFNECLTAVQDHRDVSWVPLGEMYGPFEDFTVLEQSRTVLYFDVITAAQVE